MRAPIDTDNGDYYSCDVWDCEAVLCDDCGCDLTCDGYYCPQHRGSETLMDSKESEYVYPYAFGDGDQFTFGVEIELESSLSEEFVENVTNSDIIAGWDKDASLENGNGVELQSNILTMAELPALKRIIEGIPEYGENAGGHIHVARTDNQCASRWYWALRGLNASQCRRLNMRHIDDDYWCSLVHGEYTGKHTASRPRNRWNVPRCVCSSVRDTPNCPNVTRVSASISRPRTATPEEVFGGGNVPPPPLWEEETCVLL